MSTNLLILFPGWEIVILGAYQNTTPCLPFPPGSSTIHYLEGRGDKQHPTSWV